ncbi:GH39 family glycosyl hydrolase, partial [Commensalibacter intestini]|uniref:GH39 family glycosyl hydrolase n=1 Tax=Commensalibacter intestini TaxID=479936 RepID=UPI000A39060B
TYWEIWNEPDLTIFWNNNVASNYYSFYSKIARVIKSIDPSAKVGGSAVAAGYNPGGVYIDGFLNYCKNNNTPIDFISWHYYGNLTGDPQNILDVGNSIQTTLAKYGYGNLESICSEWNSTPFSSAYSFSRVQSAKNAAYISSVLMYMQYCKTDRAHYYRADASSFGLFNDNPQPNNTASKSFCSYAGQSFGLFSKLLDETPYILNQTNDFTTGLTTLATENAAGNKMNILAANYKVDLDFTLAKTPPTVAYQQYYLDANRTTDQLNDDWSKNEWFGGKDPNTLTYNNTVTQNPAVENTSQYGADGELTARPRNYTQSNAGAGLTINNIASKHKAYTITVYRIKEGGRLDRMTPEEVTSSISAYMSNGTLSITDTGATLSTVTLYSIEFTTDGNDNGNCNDPISLNYTVTASANTTMPLSFFLPKDYIFVKTHTSYKLELSVPSTAISNCPNGTAMTGAINTCSSNAPIQFSYDPSTSSFVPFKNNVLCRDISGPTYICLPKTTVVQCNLTAPAGTLVPQVYADASNNDGKTYYNPDCNSGDPVSVSYTVDYFTANTTMPLTLFLPKDYIFLYPNISYKLELSVPSTAIYQCPNGTGMTGSLSTCSSNAPIQFSYDPSTSSFVPFRNGRLYSAVAGRTYIRLPTRQQVKCTLTALPGTLVPAEYS